MCHVGCVSTVVLGQDSHLVKLVCTSCFWELCEGPSGVPPLVGKDSSCAMRLLHLHTVLLH